MSPRSTDYALLSQDVYHDTAIDKMVTLDGIRYRVLDAANDPVTGFQAQAYVREDVQPQQVIVAFRGTEFDRQPVRDGGVDAGMVLTGINLQTGDALAFTRRVMDKATQDAADEGRSPPDITVTGHSLGGTLAEISAAKFGLKGETFNAYGAAGLRQGIPEGGTQVIDHVRAGDLVSAASAHFGEVRIYATQQDIDTLSKAGYRDDSGLLSLRNPIKATDFSAHAIDNFVPNSKLLGQSIISDENQARYRAHEGMVDRYRNDVMDIRQGISAPWEIPRTIGQIRDSAEQKITETFTEVAATVRQDIGELSEEIRRGVNHAKETLAGDVRALEQKVSSEWNTLTHSGKGATDTHGATLLTNPIHPDHTLFKQAEDAVHRLDREHHRAPDQKSENLAASLTIAARSQGMNRIDEVLLSTDGNRAFAVEGNTSSPLKKIAGVDTKVAIETSIEQSSESWRTQAEHLQQNSNQVTHQAASQSNTAFPLNR